MCFCCCTTRKSILIYAIVISSFAFIYGIVAISKFGSNTEIYKVLISTLKALETQKDSYSDYKSSNSDYNSGYNSYYNSYSNNYKIRTKKNRRIAYDDDYYYYNIYGNSKYTEAILNSASYSIIKSLTPSDIKTKKYGLIKSLKGIENGLGVVLFIFPIIFLGIEILFLIFIWGIKEYKVLPLNIFNVFNIIKIICIILSTLFIVLSALYSLLLIIALIQYIKLLTIIDSCSIGIIVGMIFGYYGIWYYIVLSCAFCHERTKFINVGNEQNIGPEAQYDINGNKISKIAIINQPIVIAPSSIQPQNPHVIEVKQNQLSNKIQQNSNSNGIGNEYIVLNGIVYRRDDNANINNININNKSNDNNNNQTNNIRRNSVKRNSIRRNSIKKKSIKSNKSIKDEENDKDKESVRSSTEFNKKKNLNIKRNSIKRNSKKKKSIKSNNKINIQEINQKSSD